MSHTDAAPEARNGAILAVVQARMSSTRLPGKVLAPILGKPMVLLQLERLGRARRLDAIMVATSDDASDDGLAETLRTNGVSIFRGPLADVLARYQGAVDAYERDHGPVAHVVRITADCPVIDPEIVDAVVDLHVDSGAEYSGNAFERSYPDGLDAEIMTRATLERLVAEAETPDDREHVTHGVNRRRNDFRISHLVQKPDLSRLRWTVDTPADLAFIRRVFERLYPENPQFRMADVLALGPEFERWAD